MNNTIDARGMACPKPVIMTKKELESMNSGALTVLVDNEVAVKNLEKLASSLGYICSNEENEGEYKVMIVVGEGKVETEETKTEELSDEVVLIAGNTMGEGSEELGKILMKGFIYTLTESKPYPKAILLYNSGVMLTTEGSESIEDFKKLEAAGVELISCGTCLNYFGLGDKLLVGEVSNMYTIVEKMKTASNTIRI